MPRRLPDRGARSWPRCAAGAQCVLLIDEIDRADDDFEAFLARVPGATSRSPSPSCGTMQAPHAAAGRADLQPHARAARRARDGAASTTGSTIPRPEREAAIVRLHNPSLPERAATSLVAAVGGGAPPAAAEEARRLREHRLVARGGSARRKRHGLAGGAAPLAPDSW